MGVMSFIEKEERKYKFFEPILKTEILPVAPSFAFDPFTGVAGSIPVFDHLLEDMERTGKIYGFDDSIVGSFLEDYEEEMSSFMIESKNTKYEKEGYGTYEGLHLSELLRLVIKRIGLKRKFNGYISKKRKNRIESPLHVSDVQLLQRTISSEYFRSKLN